MSVTCERQIPNVTGLKDQEITVGRHIFLQCTGDWDKSFQFQKAQLVLDEKSKFLAKIFKAEARSGNQFDMDLVIYSAGEIDFPDLRISDGAQEISLGENKFLVQSVIEKTQADKKPEPYGPVLPLRIPFPASYILIFSALIVVVLVAIGWTVRKRYRYRKLMAKLKNYDALVAPDSQFYRSLRKAELSGYALADLETAFRLYLTRKFQVPAFDLKDPSLLRFFKKNNPWLKKERLEVKKILEDLKLAKNTDSDKKLLTQKMYQFVDKAEALKLQANQSQSRQPSNEPSRGAQ